MFTGLRLLAQAAAILLQPRSLDPNRHHPFERLRTSRYRAKKRVVRGLWIACGILMLAYPISHFIITLALFTTFLSFTILDETP